MDGDGSDDDYKVGYKKPPKATQFKKGRSGNGAGKKPRTKNMVSLINRELDQLVTMKENGKEIRLPKREAIVKRLVNLALTGSPRHIDFLIKYCAENGVPDPFQVEAGDLEAVKAALAAMVGTADDDDGSTGS